MKKIALFCFLFALAYSCKKEPEASKHKEPDPVYYIDSLETPDTLVMNTKFKGYFKVNLNFKEQPDESETTHRFLFLYVTKEDVQPVLDSVKDVAHTIFIDTTGNGLLNYHIQFDEPGEQRFTALIEDVKFMKELTEEGNVSIVKNKTSFTHNVYVKP